MAKQWTVDELINTVKAFQPACILAAAAELDIFAALNNGPMSSLSLAAQLASNPRATRILLDALAAMELLEKNAELYAVPPSIAEILTKNGSRNILPALRHHANCLRRWARLPQVVLTGKPAERTPSINGRADDEADFIGAMDNFSRPLADQVVDRLQPLAFRQLLDVAGASGTWTIAFLRAVPDAKATLFDRPSVIPMARRRLAAAALAERVTLAAGDYLTDDLPTGADFALLSAVAHQNSRDQNKNLFAKIHAALDPDGALVLRDIVMDPSRTKPAPGAMFAVNMLVATEGGRTYTFDEFRQDLTAAGFHRVTLLQHDQWMNSLIRAEKAKD